MNILHISRTMGQGGAEKVVVQLCENNMWHKQMVASCGGEFVNDLENKGVTHYWIPDIDKKNPVLMAKCFFRLLRIVKKEKVDILHSHHRMAAFYARLIAMLTHTKCVYTAHNVFHNKVGLMRFAIKNATIVAVGDGVKQNLVSVYGMEPSRVNVVYNSIVPTAAGIKNPELERLRRQGMVPVGAIGRLCQQKGIDVFIKAIGRVVKEHPNAVGVIVGNGEDEQALKELANSLGLRKNILFLGYQKNILDIISQLSFVVLSSRWEGLPLTVIETFSQGRTIVASNISGNNEIVKDGVNGLLFEKDDDAQLAEKINIMLEDSAQRTALSKNAYETYIHSYSYESFINGYKEIYETLAE